MIQIPKKDLAEFYRLDVHAQLHVAKARVRFFKEKYGQSFTEFEEQVQKERRDFDYWDDYIEWKAYTKLLTELEQNLRDLEHEDIQLSG